MKKYYNGSKERFDKELRSKIKAFLKLIRSKASDYDYLVFTSAKNDFSVDEFNFLSKDAAPIPYKFSYADSYGALSCFGMGINSYSYILNKLRCGEIGINFYLPRINFNQKVYIATEFKNVKEQKIFYILNRLTSDNILSSVAYKKLFGSNLMDDFRGPIDKLSRLNKVKIKDNFIYFIPRLSKEKFIYSLFFFDRIIDKKLNLLRSEEHTSELQSHSFISYAVFCLKKKKTTHTTKQLKKNYKTLHHTRV